MSFWNRSRPKPAPTPEVATAPPSTSPDRNTARAGRLRDAISQWERHLSEGVRSRQMCGAKLATFRRELAVLEALASVPDVPAPGDQVVHIKAGVLGAEGGK